MPDEQGFLAAIREAPDDDTPRLIYADWLDDRGEADRAEFIRVQCEAERLPEFDPRKVELDERWRRLLAARESDWLGPVGVHLREPEFPPRYLRGMLNAVALSASAFLEHADTFFKTHPVQTIQIDEIGDQGPLLAESHSLSLIRRLILGYDNLTAAQVSPMILSPHLSNLRQFFFGANPVGTEGIRVLTGATHLQHLTGLLLSRCGIGANGAEALAECGHLNSLTHLELAENNLGSIGVEMLTVSKRLTHLECLGLDANGISDAGVRALAIAPSSEI